MAAGSWQRKYGLETAMALDAVLGALRSNRSSTHQGIRHRMTAGFLLDSRYGADVCDGQQAGSRLDETCIGLHMTKCRVQQAPGKGVGFPCKLVSVIGF
jgi:hypothetical protein